MSFTKLSQVFYLICEVRTCISNYLRGHCGFAKVLNTVKHKSTHILFNSSRINTFNSFCLIAHCCNSTCSVGHLSPLETELTFYNEGLSCLILILKCLLLQSGRKLLGDCDVDIISCSREKTRDINRWTSLWTINNKPGNYGLMYRQII